MNNTELTHYGVKGMKWGVRKTKNVDTPKQRRHLGIDERGNLNLITGKTSAKAKKLFATQLAISLGTTALSMYIAKNPQVVVKGQKAVQDFLRKAKDVS